MDLFLRRVVALLLRRARLRGRGGLRLRLLLRLGRLGLGVAFLLRLRRRTALRSGAVVGRVEARTLEHDAHRMEDAPQRTAALRTDPQRLVLEALLDLDAMAVRQALVFV